MISNISSWAENIIIAVIIATIIEMILPNGNSKKYIKTVIGIYILYTIISPVIVVCTGSDLKIDYSKYESLYAEEKDFGEEYNEITSKTIESTYKKELETEIKNDLEENFEVKVKSMDIDVDLETGEIKSLILNLKGNTQINKIEIGNSSISNKDIEKIKNILNENYSISYENITIKS